MACGQIRKGLTISLVVHAHSCRRRRAVSKASGGRGRAQQLAGPRASVHTCCELRAHVAACGGVRSLCPHGAGGCLSQPETVYRMRTAGTGVGQQQSNRADGYAFEERRQHGVSTALVVAINCRSLKLFNGRVRAREARRCGQRAREGGSRATEQQSNSRATEQQQSNSRMPTTEQHHSNTRVPTTEQQQSANNRATPEQQQGNSRATAEWQQQGSTRATRR